VTRGPLVVVGDALLDRDVSGRAERLSPDAPVPVVSELTEIDRPGGAALAALLAARDGVDVVLVTALGIDAAGERVAALLAGAGVRVVAGRLPGRTPTKERVRVAGQSLLRLDREEVAPRPPSVTDAMCAAVRGAGAVLVSDYGRRLMSDPALLSEVERVARTVPVAWDPHPRGADPVPGLQLVTPNLAEALRFTGLSADGGMLSAAARAARQLAARWKAGGVVVTLGPGGALLAGPGPDDVPLAVPVQAASPAGDPCGAGDRFAATVAGWLAAGAPPSEAVTAGVEAASAYVAAGGPASLSTADGPSAGVRPGRLGAGRPRRSGVDGPRAAAEVVRRTRAAGGIVVATGGCFDLLHAGHVATLAAARRLGDCLVVCLNSDESVRRLKGEGRPLVPERDRVRVLEALGAVDAVTVFGEDTPLAVLDAIRPDVWVKGGDYAAPALPETELLAHWGGEVVVVPYLAGRSTSRLVETARDTDETDMTSAGRQDG
jgi:D-beta-D-heptose 7-phosphate kinase/D-beta-D-heptose 1-phosphate adenosyltransferase